jgi:hypothetical protein
MNDGVGAGPSEGWLSPPRVIADQERFAGASLHGEFAHKEDLSELAKNEPT